MTTDRQIANDLFELTQRMADAGYGFLSDRGQILKVYNRGVNGHSERQADTIAARMGFIRIPSEAREPMYQKIVAEPARSRTREEGGKYSDRYTWRRWSFTPREDYLIAEVDHFMDARVYGSRVEVWPIFVDPDGDDSECVWENQIKDQADAFERLGRWLRSEKALSIRRLTMKRSRAKSFKDLRRSLRQAGYEVVVLEAWDNGETGLHLTPGEWIGVKKDGSHGPAERRMQAAGFCCIDFDDLDKMSVWIAPNQLPTDDPLSNRPEDRKDANRTARMVLAGSQENFK